MGIKKYKPTTPGLRGMTVSTFEEITTSTPEKSLTVTLKKNAGRNNRGCITVRHQGGGYRKKYRIIDFKRYKDDIPATVKTIEYDPNRSANIALVCYADGEKKRNREIDQHVDVPHPHEDEKRCYERECIIAEDARQRQLQSGKQQGHYYGSRQLIAEKLDEEFPYQIGKSTTDSQSLDEVFPIIKEQLVLLVK